MPLRVTEVVIDCADHGAVVDFWVAAMGYERHEVNEQYVAVVPPAPAALGRPPLLFQKVPEPKVAKNRVHLDLRGRRHGRRGGAARGARGDGHRGAVVGPPHLDGDGRPGGQRVLRLRRRLTGPGQRASSAARAAWTPHIPCTPPPGGVDDEHTNRPGSGVVYGFQRTTGRNRSWRTSWTPPLMSPPT